MKKNGNIYYINNNIQFKTIVAFTLLPNNFQYLNPFQSSIFPELTKLISIN